MTAPSAPLRVGLVGLRFGRHLLRALVGLPGVEVVAAADRNAGTPLLAEIAAPRGLRLHADALGMLDAGTLDAVVIATSPRRRGPLLQACADRGLPVFVEKPWAGNPAQARAFAEACGANGARVMVGFSFRFHPAVRRLRALLDGELGPAWMANGEYAFDWGLPPGGWLWEDDAGGGVFNENSCHLLDVLVHLLGAPVAVSAATARPRPTPGAELAAVTLRFASGAVAAVTLGAHGAPAMDRSPRLDVVTAHGRAELSGRGHVWQSVRWASRSGGPEHRESLPPETLGRTRYTDALGHFVECVRSGRPPSASIADGILAVDLAAAILRSAASGREELLAPAPRNGL